MEINWEDLEREFLEEDTIRYCANDPCDNEAVYLVQETQTPLCHCCAQAYQLGAANQHTVMRVDYLSGETL